MEWTFNSYHTLILATLVLLLGKALVNKIKFLRDFNIPDPVVGGLVAAVVLYGIHLAFGNTFSFDSSIRNAFMLVFFSSIGLSADFSRLRAGGKPLVVFLVLVSVFILVQNVVGIGLASLLGLDPLLGLITGSITLTGGHGTAGAWGEIFENKYHINGAVTLGMASATFGLVAGGLIGGPVARRLIQKHLKMKNLNAPQHIDDEQSRVYQFEGPEQTRLITATSAVETMALFAACLSFAHIMTGVFKGAVFELPTFVWALFGGVVLRNVLVNAFNVKMFDRAIDVFGNASLSLFLAMAFLSLKLWELAGLAGPVLIILAVQTVVMILYASYVTFRLMGKDYDAAILAAGHCGFGMGATPTAIANMQVVTEKFGPSHKAFLIVPMVGAFFIDLVNAAVLQFFASLSFLH
ncbi:sodium/glutamate symporter [Stenoxybacter acetivorans]|uniref:sodium/glutamate symporter n=1 Tax=Stenoxybacter acetivorans TaxID=422441 RepID=UPI0005643B34|nr:sodium/glutamate symporter [Stenoxybacter acetivorans]